VLVLYGLFLAHHFAPAISSPDANGYWAQGSLLAATGRTWFVPESDVQYVGMHWLVTEDGRYFSRYPPGLAVPIALLYKLFGYRATVLVNPLFSVFGLVGMFLLARQVAGAWWATLAVVALAVTPDYVRHALQDDSHMAVTALLLWGLWFLWRWHRTGRWPDILGAGLVMGAIPTVRYPEALYACGVGSLLLVHIWRQPRRWWHAGIGLAGALVPLLPLLVRNQLAFGAFWRTAYSLTHEQTGFAWDYFRAHGVSYVRALNAEGVGLFFGLGLVGIGLLCCRREERPWGLC
jgi:4-amino-4-deoxy-L-arabinose transferase-like glycosyltransferase